MLKKKLLEPNADFNYHETDAYKNQRYKVHQIDEVNPLEFQFDKKWTEQPELDVEQYQVLQVPKHLLVPPGEWDPTPKSKSDFGDTGLLTKTTGDSNPWSCSKCKYDNRPGVLCCEICNASKPVQEGQKAENMNDTSKPTTTTPWTFDDPDDDNNKKEEEEDDNEENQQNSNILGLNEANNLLKALDGEHYDEGDETSDSSTDSDDSNDSDDSFDGHFGIQAPPNIYVVFNPPLRPDDSSLIKLRNKNQRERWRNNQRALREKEDIVMTSCEQALDSISSITIKRAIKMADALIDAVGIIHLNR